jgi:DNA-binding LytR/AlgR family response regulator
MRAVTAVIAEDEPLLREGLRVLLEKLWPALTIGGMAENGQQALDIISSRKPDIAFLDIRMPGLTGIDVAKRIAGQCMVVFVTAYDQYAVEAFETEAVDYILKPLSEARVSQCVQRLQARLQAPGSPSDTGVKLERLIQVLENRAEPDYLRLVKVRLGADILFVPVYEALFFRADEKYTTVQTTKTSYLLSTSIKALEAQLDPGRFWRVHRSAIVNVERIARITRTLSGQMQVHFRESDERIPVSRAYEHLFKP